MDSKQRSKLKSLAQKLETIIQIGKNGITDETIKVVGNAFNNKELIKIKKIESAPIDEKEIARILSEKTKSEVVQIIGSKIVLYKKNQDKNKKIKNKVAKENKKEAIKINKNNKKIKLRKAKRYVEN